MRAKLINDQYGQSVLIPDGFRFHTKEVTIHKVDNAVVLMPKQVSWEKLKQSLNMFSDDFMENRSQPD